jgi:DNA-binding SARP family transcriptional activator/tetratricopeptide (TPR) repeat protein
LVPSPVAAVSIDVELLGGFRIRDGDREVREGDWPARRAQELVALLALTEGRRLVRDRVLENLWPHLNARAAGANLRKAAHHARRVLGDPDAVVLRSGAVELFPGRKVTTDVERFLAAAAAALGGGDPAVCARVAAMCRGELLPGSPYETWTQDARRAVHARRVELLRQAGDFERLLDAEPTDEVACRELMRAAIERGQRHVAIRWYERLRLALARDLRVQPDADTRVLYDRCVSGVRPTDPVFVGRGLELATAMGALATAKGGGATAILVRGPTGIGKSALCRELVERAGADGWRVLSSACTASGAPYAPIAAAVEPLLVEGHASLDGVHERTRSVLAELTPIAGPAPALAGPLTRHQVIAAFRRALALAGSNVPTLLLVDDAHLADEATADVVHQLVAGGAGTPLAVVLASRAEWMRTSLPRGVAELARSELTATIELGPLREEEIARLVADAGKSGPSQDVVDRIARLAEGSPFFALELARASATGAPGALPRTVRAAITERFLTLAPDAVDALAKLAVADGDLDLASVLALTGLDEDDAGALLDAALVAGVLVVSGARYRFRHELVRQTLIEGLAPHRMLALHRDAARRLVEAKQAPELIAHHFVQARCADEALPFMLAAARRAVQLGAFRDALAQVERLLQQDPEHHDGLRVRAEVLDALGDRRAPDAYAAAARAIGEPEAQELTARRALAQLKASEPRSALKTLEGCAPRTTVGRLAEALTYSAAAAIGVYGDAESAAAKADEAHALAVELGDPGAILDATWAHALAAHANGELPARLRTYLRSTAALPEIATHVFDGQLCVTERLLHGGLPNDEIISFANDLAAEAEHLGAARGHAFAVTLRGEAEVLAGRLDEADGDFADGARLHGRIGAAAGEALSLLGRAHVAISRGRPERARPHLADALLLARESEVGHHTLDRIYGAMIEAAADPQAALDLIREAETAIRGPLETCPTCRIAFVVPAAIGAARAGDLDRARRYAADCAQALEVIALPPAWHASGSEVRGWLARAEGRKSDAAAHFRAAADVFADRCQPVDAERCARLAATVAA